MKTKLISGSEVQVGTILAYLGKPFPVVYIERTEDHPTFGPARIAYDDRERGMMIFDNHTATVPR